MWPVFLLLLWLGPVIPKQKTGSCSQPQPLCCPRTDHHCKRGSCYCDEFCHVFSDCCPDHGTLCIPGDPPAGSLPPMAQLDAVPDRAHTPKMALQMVLRVRRPMDSASSNQDWVQNMVLQLLHTSLARRPLSATVKGIRKTA
ncbi:somatomedin-B and thrombospondin type-1 domain-containing protein-like [Sigmodon hispidus]